MFNVRASSISDFFDCPARWEAKHLQGMRMPSSDVAAIGKAIHAGAAAYDVSVINKAGLTVDEAAGAAVDMIHNPDEETVWTDVTVQDAEKIAVAVHKNYCREITPKQNYVAVEAECSPLVISDLGITLTGSLDRIRRECDDLGICDIKSGKLAVGSDGVVKIGPHAAQMGVYEILAEQSAGVSISLPAQIIGVQTGKTEKAQRVGIGEIKNARDVLIGSEEDKGLLQFMSDMLKSGTFYGNPRSMLCHEKYCVIYKSCKFRR